MKMANTVFKTFENKDDYNDAAYKSFLSDLERNDASWSEFLPTPLTQINESILIRTKLVGTDNWQTFNIPNGRLYMLKNEIRHGCHYGFAYTDFFNAIKTIHNTKKWFPETSGFKAYLVQMESTDNLRVIDYTYRTDEEHKKFLNQMLQVSTLFSQTNKLMCRFKQVMDSKPNKYRVMKTFASYMKPLMIVNGVDENTFVEGKGTTQYHFFNLIEKSESFGDFKRRLSVYNLGFEQMATNFEAFYSTFCHTLNQDASALKNIEDFSRKIYIG